MAQSPSYATYTMKTREKRIEGAAPTSQSSIPQSRELGLVTPEITETKPSPFAKSWPHLVAGGYVSS